MARDRVSVISVPWQKIVNDADPDFQQGRSRELEYDFGALGHGARDFYADPEKRGAYSDLRIFLLAETGEIITQEDGNAIEVDRIGDFDSRDFDRRDFYTEVDK